MTAKFMLGALVALSIPGLALADTSGKKIALSNNYAGNSWRQAMLKSWDKVAKQAVADGVVAAADAFTTAENQAAEQAAQIQNLILQGYDAIVLNAASPDALNGAVKEACDAGIVVVSFDGIVTEPCAYRVTVDFKKHGRAGPLSRQAHAERRQPARDPRPRRHLLDDDITKGIQTGVAKHPQFKIVGAVHGNWDQTTAQKAVAGILPTLPEINGGRDQGGDGYGAAQAFAAAGRPTPADHHGQPPGRARLVEGAEGQERLRAPCRRRCARLVDLRLLGGAADPGRPAGAQGRCRGAIPAPSTQDELDKISRRHTE